MNDNVLNASALGVASSRPYTLAGWLSIAMAVLFPLGFLLSMVQQIIVSKAAGQFYPSFGLGEIVFTAQTVIAVYVYLQFRKLLNERYGYAGINTLITLSIVWVILILVESVGIKLFMLATWPVKELTAILIEVPFMAFNLISIGLIDLFIGLRLLHQKEKLGERFMTYAYITLIAAICELTLILAPIALILIPVSSVILGMIFLREKEEAEFV